MPPNSTAADNGIVSSAANQGNHHGALKGIRVIEMAGIGPGPFCAMMLADMGAEVIRIDRLAHKGQGHRAHTLNRGRRSLALDLKNPDALDATLRLVDQADVLVEGSVRGSWNGWAWSG